MDTVELVYAAYIGGRFVVRSRTFATVQGAFMFIRQPNTEEVYKLGWFIRRNRDKVVLARKIVQTMDGFLTGTNDTMELGR